MNCVTIFPKVFISYSHDSPEHKDGVLRLANQLREDGIDCKIDQYEESPPQGWPRWANDEIDLANFVLIVCTEQYNRRYRGHEEIGKGKGVTWEGAIVIQHLYEAQGNNTKYIPIVFFSQDSNYIPTVLAGVSFYNVGIAEGYEKLLRRLTNQPWIQKPPLGTFKALPKRDRKQYFLDEAQHADLREELLAASKGLLNWKRTLGDEQEIERPELEKLLNRIDTEDSSTTIVLGVPGCGKSALMAKLGHSVVDKGYALLAIKADFLGNDVNNLEDLQRDDQLNFSVNLREAIKAVANKEKVVLLVDQLDAISELLNRRSGRLNVLLNLIQSVAGTKGVHIVATCREFEFRHGSQFARLEGFEQLILSLPTWEKIAPILEQAGHATLSIGEPLCELLRNPLHLKIFLEVAKPGEVFDSSQKLLDKLWEKRILDEPNAFKYIDFLEQIAQRMTTDEVLWLPTAIADSCPEVFQALEKAGILMKNPDNSTFGFCHQTYYDHTLARVFARGSQSLLDLVLERQDGLFVRPILLRGLNYLRGTAPREYAKLLQSLLQNSQVNNFPLKNIIAELIFKNLTHLPDKIRLRALSVLRFVQIIYIRTHIYTLLIEFVGSQQNPQPVEAELLIPLLNLETEAPKVLDAMIGSRGWFNRLYNSPEFRQCLGKPPTQASYCLPILTAATSFALDNVWNLIEEYWLNDTAYDAFSMRIISSIQQWNREKVWYAQQIIRRSNLDIYSVLTIAEKVAETLPQLAPRILRAHLDYKLEQAIKESKKPIPELAPNASDVERYVNTYKHNPKDSFKSLLESGSHFDDMEALAKVNPQYFLDSIWSWFTDVTSKIVDQENFTINRYYEDQMTSLDFEKSEIIQAVLSAILELASRDKQAFLNFVIENETSELLLVHRLLARGLAQIAPKKPQAVWNYLLGDSRRLSLGDSRNAPKETKQLMEAVCPHLQAQEITHIEQTIRTYNYYFPTERELSPDLRLSFLQYNRKRRLKLLLAFPEKYLSVGAKRWRDEEIRAFPWIIDEKDYNYAGIAQIVGSPMNVEEMARASDQHLLNLFDELADITQADYWKRQKDLSRAGGASSQAWEFARLVKENPQRFLRIIPKLQPQRHEIYAGYAIRELADTDFSINTLIELVESLEQRGFVSEDFRSNTASGLEKIAERNQGLPQSILSLLENWLTTHSQPDLAHYRNEEQRSHQLNSPILFGSGGSHFLPSGRGDIIRAIGAGYLKQNPPDLQNWVRLIKSRLGVEPHPNVWVDILTHMPPLLNGDRQKATQLFDAVIHNCPEVLQYRWSLQFISRCVGWFEPQETVQGWLEMLLVEESSFCYQVYGELLFIYYFQYQDDWSVAKINYYLTVRDNEAILCGLAHAASQMWFQKRCRAKAAEILYNLASSSIEAIQSALAKVFFQSREHFELDSGMRLLIPAVCKNKPLLIKAASDIIEIIENNNFVDTQPQLVSDICQNLLDNLEKELGNPTGDLVFATESLTRLAIQLHRKDKYREIGLRIFEQLLSLNLRETRSALEILDRKPNRLNFYQPLRRKRRRRQISSSSN